MLNIKFNNKILSVEPGINLQQLLLTQGYSETHFAVAVNQSFVPRSLYLETTVHDNDVIETVTPMQGG